MDKNNNIDGELNSFRRQIDDIDEKIIRLLMDRMAIVGRIGELKRKNIPGQCPIRPGREAEMVRRIMKKFDGHAFSPMAAASLWRILIGTSTSVESALKVSAYTPERNDDLMWMAREYFGAAVPVIKQPHIKRVIGDVMDNKAAVGIVPTLKSEDTTYWWTNLLQQGSNAPKIFAHIPFVYSTPPDKNTPGALAIARVEPEASGDDVSLLVLEADHNVSQHRMQTAFSQVKLPVTWINIATLSPSTRHHLVEIKGFITPEDTGLKNLLSALGNSIVKVDYLGAYAVPVILNNKEPVSKPHVVAAPTA